MREEDVREPLDITVIPLGSASASPLSHELTSTRNGCNVSFGS